MEAVLREVGRVPTERILRLADPTPAALLEAFRRLGVRVAADAAVGRSSLLFFYYSGHARADALDLGDEPLALDALRGALEAVPAAVRIVVLDACQSGAFSRVKGARPVPDFAVRSIDQLTQQGTAIMASSTGSELSQESPELGGSYFTHHLAVGLRGAADRDDDGRVTLREAYEYAYHRTILATAATAVGRQHPVLETRLAGRGDVVLTWPRGAGAELELSAAEPSTVLLSTAGEVVVGELHLGRGAERVRVALPPGAYQGLVRSGEGRRRCSFAVAVGETTRLDVGACPAVVAEPAAVKGVTGAEEPESLALELTFGFRLGGRGAYADTLEGFGFASEPTLFSSFRFAFTVVKPLAPAVSLFGTTHLLEHHRWGRGIEVSGEARRNELRVLGFGQTFGMRLSTSIGWGARAYAQGGLGAGWAVVDLDGARGSHWGWVLSSHVGFDLPITAASGLLLQAGWMHAPVVENLLGDSLESGGLDLAIGFAVRW